MAKLEDLQEFVDSRGGNRGRAEFFVGRKDELAVIENACVQTIKRKTNPDPAESMNDPGGLLFSGAPGMGKTALLMEARAIAQDAAQDDAREGVHDLPRIVGAIRERLQFEKFATPLVVNAAPGQLTDEKPLLELCAEEARRLRDGATARSLALGASILADQFTRIDSDRVIDELGKIDILQRPLVVLLIDEAQNSNEDNRKLYEMLHLGLHQLPIVSVFAGLSDSRAALKRAGISRFAHGHHLRLGSLAEEDCKEAMKAFLDRYEIDTGSAGAPFWEDFAVENSSLFPHHLNTVLIASAETALADGGKLHRSDRTKVQGRVETRKQGYYEDRADDFTAEERQVAAIVVVKATLDMEDPHRTARDELAGVPTKSVRADGAPDVIGFVERMVHSGMLQEIGQGRYECPIPSFALWLDRDYGDGRYARTAEPGGS